ncbi:GIY-YIG nuclease family protein [uncultured Limosilactobacillus sp.]|uniref:GIY-YIG nuclease family protein n=1 Tax=uncultured Limosilactobacillus sp. TaxID=2837629 RepID=UPI0025DD9AEF|nr:GIY-YIG nuclease family protein [uncultured Limosilactobacillus sp.]
MTQMNSFSLDVQHRLKNYVYALVDPRPDQDHHCQGTIFYIGRGVGNRVFDHEKEAHQGVANGEYAKLQRILAIEKAGYRVQRMIISWGLTNDEAIVVEGALIDFLKIIDLQNYGGIFLNRMAGYHNDDQDQASLPYETVEEINARLAMPEVSLKALCDQHIGLITLGTTKDTQDAANYQLLGSAAFNSDKVARRSFGNWVIGQNVDKLKYLLVVTHGDYVIVGAFRILKPGNIIDNPHKYQRRRIYWRDSPTNKDQPLATNDYVQPVTEINGIKVGPNMRLGDVWFRAQQSGLNIVDNK